MEQRKTERNAPAGQHPLSQEQMSTPTSVVKGDVFISAVCFYTGTPDAAAGIGVHWDENNPKNIKNRVNGRQTHQRAAILAALAAVKMAKDNGIKKLTVCTNFQNVVKAMNGGMNKWLENKWRQGKRRRVANRDLWQELHNAASQGIVVKWFRADDKQEVITAKEEGIKAKEEGITAEQGGITAKEEGIKAEQEGIKAKQEDKEAKQKAIKAKQEDKEAKQKAIKAKQEAKKAKQEAKEAEQKAKEDEQKAIKANQEGIKAARRLARQGTKLNLQ